VVRANLEAQATWELVLILPEPLKRGLGMISHSLQHSESLPRTPFGYADAVRVSWTTISLLTQLLILHDWKTQAIARAHRALETGKTPRPGPSKRTRTHDIEIFRRSDAVMSEMQLHHFISDLDDDAFYSDVQDPLYAWEDFFKLEGNQYLIHSIRSRSTDCRAALLRLRRFTGSSFFPYGDARRREYALYPDLNVDRQGSGTNEEMRRYFKAQAELHQHVKAVHEAYILYRRSVKEQLAI
jgi:hypothetical protein